MQLETENQQPAPPQKRKAYKGIAMEGFIAKWYAKTTKNSMDEYSAWAKIASDHVSRGASILEVAPGPGYLSIELARLGNYEITGLDISKTFVKIATEKARAAGVRVNFRHGDAAYMPFPDGSFDFAICTSAFKNFPEPVKVLDEIFRVLKSPGNAVIIDLRKDASKAEIDQYVKRLKLNPMNAYVTKFIFKHALLKSAHTRSEIQEFAAKSRFETCEIQGDDMTLEIWLRK
jgi:ubiquinone/menaquinone biosynthesis C-methylase UbiE